MGGGAVEVSPRVVGRYVLFEEVAHGGMATVYLGRLRGPAGFARTVAIKELHAQYARDPSFVALFLDEAKVAARIKHPNVVSVLDVVRHDNDLLLVMDYIAGESLSNLLESARKKGLPPSPEIVARCICDVLAGLHAAHETRNDDGEPLDIVHRDVSPQNILVGTDGVARVLDFGIARASDRSKGSTTGEGMIRGKVSYMSPEQLSFEPLDRRSDIYSASVVLWESLVGEPLHGSSAGLGGLVALILLGDFDPPSKRVPGIPPELDAVVMRGLSRDPATRFSTAEEMALALEEAVAHVPSRNVAQWVASVADETLRQRADLVSRTERYVLPTMTDWPPPLVSRAAGAAPSETAAPPRTPSADAEAALPLVLSDVETMPPRRPFPKVVLGLAVLSLVVGVSGIAMFLGGRTTGAASAALASEPPPHEASAAAVVTVTPPSTDAPAARAPSLAVAASGPAPRGPAGSLGDRAKAARARDPVPVAPPPAVEAIVAAAPSPPPLSPVPLPATRDVEPAAAAPPAPSFDLAKASATSTVTKVNGVASGAVRSSLPATRFSACYKDALTAANRRLEGTMAVHIETDIDGRVTSTRITGPDSLASAVGPCVKRALNQLEIRNADTGGATADFDIIFKPE